MKVSVITVCYNAYDSIEKTILSVLNQTYTHVEYIIIDGGSTDGTVDIIKKYAHRLAYWVSEHDKGIYDAMNKGVRFATGEWVNFMNAGDSFYSNQILENIFSSAQLGDYMVGIARYPNGRLWIPIRKNFSLREAYKGGGVNHQASFIKRELFKEKGYDLNYKIIADELFFLEQVVLNNKKYEVLPLIICNYDNTGVSNDIKHLKEIERERIEYFENHLPMRVLKDYDEGMFCRLYINANSFINKIVTYVKYKVL